MTSPQIASPDPSASAARRRVFALLAWLALTGFFYLVIADFYRGAVLMNNPVSLTSKRQLIFWAGMLFAAAGWLSILAASVTGRFPAGLLRRMADLRARIPLPLRALAALVLLLVPTWLFQYSPVGFYALGYWSRLGTLLVFSVLAALVFFRGLPAAGWILAFGGMVLAGGSLFTAAGWLTRVTGYPFSLGWSEGNRIYDYSMLFGASRYPGLEKAGFTFISLGRQVLWALPFLLPGITLWGMRLWDAALWILPGLALGWLAAPGRSRLWKLAFAVWTFIFIAQGPIYAPLVVSAILVVLAVRSRSLALALVLVIFSAYYANISRYTWTYAPGLWAGMLALLQAPDPNLTRGRLKQLVRPAALGAAGYFGGELLPDLVRLVTSGGSASVSLVVNAGAAVSRQPLLWDRLYPNPTYTPGILLGTLWAALPVAALVGWLLARRLWRPNWLQIAGCAAVSLAFLAVGLVASVKIGGGSNLHNLDMFWLTLVLLAAWSLRPLAENGGRLPGVSPILAVLLSLALIAPATYNVQYGTPLSLPPADLSSEALKEIQTRVAQASQTGEVLFVDQRQLVTFGMVPPVPFIADYEKKYMMDQAMAGDVKYFEQFHADLERHRFALIITEPVRVNYVNEDTRNFAEENNAWVKFVSAPILDNYQPVATYDAVGVQLLVPRK